MFNHFNPLSNQADHDYYKRCIERFVILIKNKEKKIFTMMFPNVFPDEDREIKNEIQNFNDKFCISFFIMSYS